MVKCGRGRGKQLNAGWKIAKGEWVLFLHADTHLPPEYGLPIQMQMSNHEDCKWGCFEGITTEVFIFFGVVIDCWTCVQNSSIQQLQQESSVFLLAFLKVPGWSMRLVEWVVRVRTRCFHLPYGDQAIFVRQDVLGSLGGFEEVRLLEDLIMVRKLRKVSRPAIVPAVVHTSGRRWKELGIWRTVLINQLIVAAYTLGVDPDRLAKMYETTGVQREKKP